MDRTYLLHVPPGYTGAAAVPVVVDFHGHGSSAAAQIAYGDFRPLADRDTFLVVAPDGQGSPRHFTLLGATAGEADDVAFAVALVERLAADLCVDARRVYAAGMSNGGALSSVIGCRAADRFAAVGAVAAVVYVPACDDATRRTPVTAVMGTADPIVPFEGGRVNCCGNPQIAGAPATMERFAHRAGCAATAREERLAPDVLLRRWPGCDDGSEVAFYIVDGGGHTWPGADFRGRGDVLGPTTDDLDASDALWSFFRRHALPAS